MEKLNKIPTKFEVVIHPDGDVFWAEVKNIPGCYTQGKTVEETLFKMKDAIYTHFEIPAKYSDPSHLKTDYELRAELTLAKA